MSLSKEQKKLISGKIIDILDIMSGEEPEVEETEEEEEEEAPRKKKRAPKKKAKKETPTLNAVRKAMRTFSSDFSKEEAKELLEPYGVKSLSALDEDDYQSLLDDIENYEED